MLQIEARASSVRPGLRKEREEIGLVVSYEGSDLIGKILGLEGGVRETDKTDIVCKNSRGWIPWYPGWRNN